ncbi:hypothetical protein C8R43DRAFT_1044367 [Mycena crocata]|nr:hypothetical protein C8R43DRAFT_1044367 [Mycena crocata]
MRTARVISLILVSVFALAAANPLVVERQTCECQSPTGCPGRCSENGKSMCVGYCGQNTTVFCKACGHTKLGCILDDDGTCFTGNVSFDSRQEQRLTYLS